MHLKGILLLSVLFAIVFIPAYAQINGTETNGTSDQNVTSTEPVPQTPPPEPEPIPVNNNATAPGMPAEFNTITYEDFSDLGNDKGSLKQQYREETSFTKVFEPINGDPDDVADDVYVTALGLPVEIIDYNKNIKPYVKTEDSSAISVSSGQVTFSFDKQTCSATIHNAGLLKAGQIPQISSSSYIVRVAVNGTNDWTPIAEINGATCNVETFEDGKSVEIRGTKLVDDIGEMKIRYLKLYHDGLKPQIEFTNLNPSWTNHKFSIIGTDHVPEVITIADESVNIKTDPSPTQKNRVELGLDNKKLKIDIGGLEFDALTGNDQVWSVNTVYENNITKLVVDYSNQEGKIYLPGQTLVLDPLYANDANPTEDGVILDNGTNDNLDGNSLTINTAATSHDIGRYAISDGAEGGRTYYQFALTIPKYSYVIDTDFVVENGAPAGTSDGCDYMEINMNMVSATTQQKWDDIGDGTVFVNDDPTCNSSGANHSVDLGTSADTDVMSQLTSEVGFFAFGIKSDVEGALDTSYHAARFHSEENTGTPDPTLIVTYTLPVPTTPTVLLTSDTPTSKTVETLTNSTTPVGSILGYYWERLQNNTDFTALCNEPFDGSCHGLVSRFTLDGPATGLKDIVIGNVTTIVDQQIAPALGFYEFDGSTATNQATITNYDPTITVSDIFSTDNWTENDGTKVSVSGGKLNIINTRDGTNDAAVRDISTLLPNGEVTGDFTLRFEITAPTTWTTNADSVFAVGLSSTDQTSDSNDVQDGMAIEFRNVLGERRIGATWKDGGTSHIMDANNGNTAFNWATATVYYVQLQKYGGILTATVTTNSDYVTSVTKATSSAVVSGMSGIKYLKFWNGALAGSSVTEFDGTIDNIKFYNNFAVLDNIADGTISGAVTATGIRDTALNFDGVDDYVELQNTKNTFALGSPFTISAWIKPEVLSAVQEYTVFANANGDNSNAGTRMIINQNTAELIFYLQESAAIYTQVTSATNTITLGQWSHVVGTYDGTNGNEQLQIYVNGVLVDDTETDGGSGDPTSITTTSNMRIGNDLLNDDEFDGSIDDVAVFSRVLTVSEINSIYNLGQSKDIVTGSNSSSTNVSASKLQIDYEFESSQLTNNSVADPEWGTNADQIIETSATYTDQTDFDTSWVSSDTARYRGNPSTDVIDFDARSDQTDNRIAYDLGTALSDSVWSARFKITSTNYVQGSEPQHLSWSVGFTQTNVATSSNTDFIGFQESSNNAGGFLRTIDGDDVNFDTGTDTEFTTDPSITTWYVQMIRHTPTTYSVGLYSNSGYTNLIEKQSGTVATTTTGLKYFSMASECCAQVTGSADWRGNIDDIQIWNGIDISKIENQASIEVLNPTESSVWGTSASVSSETFATYVDEADSDASWISNDESKVDVNLSTDKLDWNSVRDTTTDVIDYDLGSTLSNDWTLRFALNVTSITVPDATGNYQWFGLADESGSGTTIDAIGMLIVRDSTTGKYWRVNAVNEGNPADGGDQGTLTHELAVEVVYVEILKNGLYYTLNLFSDSAYSNLIESKTVTVPIGSDNFRYFKTRNINGATNTGSIVGTVDDIVVYNNFSTLGHSNDGVIYDATIVTGKHGEAFSFDGINDEVNGINPFQNNQDYTVAFWVNHDVSGVTDAVVSTFSSGFAQEDFHFEIDNTEAITAFKRTDSSTIDADKLSSSAGVMTVGQWHHVALVYNDAVAADAANLATNALKLYVDGVMVDNTPADGSYTMTTAENLVIGNDGINNYFDGKIDDLKFYNRMLSDAEILTLAESFPVQTGKFTEEAAVFYEFDNSTATNQATITNYNITPFTDDFTSSGATSHTGNGEVNKVAGWVTNNYLKTYIDGSNDRLVFDMSAEASNKNAVYDLLQYTDDGVLGDSFRLRMKYHVTTSVNDNNHENYIILSNKDETVTNAGSQYAVGLRVQDQASTNSIQALIANNQALNTNLSTASDPQHAFTSGSDQWFEIIKTKNDVTVKIFTDSTYTTLDTMAYLNSPIFTGDGTLRYIKLSSTIAGTGTHTGWIDDIQLINGPMLGSNADGTISGAISAIGIRDDALDFDGTNDYVDTNIKKGFLDTTQTFSASVWLNPDVSQTNVIMSQNSASDEAVALWLSSNKLQFYIEDTGSLFNTCTTTNALQAGQWSHVVLTVTGQASRASSCANVNLYINGVAESLVTGGSGTVDLIPTTENLFIGAKHGTASFYNGKIDDFAIFPVVLTSSQVQQIYNTGNSLDIIDGFTGTNGTLVYPYITKQAGTETYIENDSNSTQSFTFSSSSGWTQVGTLNEISSGVLNWDADSQNADDTISYPLPDSMSYGTVRFKIQIDALSGDAEQATILNFFGLANNDMTPYDCTAGDQFVGVEVSQRVATPTFSGFKIVDDDGGTENWDDCVPFNTQDDTFAATTGDYWIELTVDRLTYNAKVYSDEWVTLVDTMTGAKSNGVYTHFIVQTYKRNNSGQVANGYIDDLLITERNNRVAGAMYFDGSTYYTTPTDKETFYDFERTEPFSTSFWLDTNTVTESGILMKSASSASAGWSVYLGSDGKIYLDLVNTATTNELSVKTNTAINNGIHHVVITYDGTSLPTGVNVYIDGVDTALTTNYNNLSATILNNLDVGVGAEQDGGAKLTGVLDDVRVYNVELTSAEAQNLYEYDLSGHEITDTNVLPDNQYGYAAAGVNQNGFGDFSEFSLGQIFTVPGAPTGLTATMFDEDRIDLSWSAPSSDGGQPITGYKIERESPTGGGWSTLIADTGNTSTTYSNTILLSSTQYNYRVSAINSVGTGSPSNADSAYTRPDAPTSLIATATTGVGGSIDLSWIASSGTITGYGILRETPIGGGFAWVADDASSPYNDSGLAGGVQFNYKIYAYNPDGNSTYSNTDDATTFDGPDPPTGVSASLPSPNTLPFRITVSWTAPSDIGSNTVITGYAIDESINNGAWTTTSAHTGSAATSFTFDHSSSPNNLIKFRVKTLGNIINGTTWSSNSTNLQLPTYPGAPTGTSVVPRVGNTSMLLSWIAPTSDGGSNIDGYLIERQTNGGGYGILVANTGNTLTTYTDSAVSDANQYEYRLKTITSVGNSQSYSTTDTAEFTTAVPTMTVQALGGNTIKFTPHVNMTQGIPDSTVSIIWIYRGDNTLVGQLNPNQVMAQGTESDFAIMYDYPEVATNYYMVVRTFNGESGQYRDFTSGTYTGTPFEPFQGYVSAIENRNATYTGSILYFVGQPTGFDMVVRYQHQDQTQPPFYINYPNVEAAVNVTSIVNSNADYYISLYYDPTFNYTGSGENSTAIIPLGYPSDLTLRSLRDPNAQPLLGIESMGDLFGLPMVFVFIIAVAAIFTGRTSPMGILIVAVLIGVMSYLGYIDFNFDPANASNAVTWAMIIVATIAGIMVGKRWD